LLTGEMLFLFLACFFISPSSFKGISFGMLSKSEKSSSRELLKILLDLLCYRFLCGLITVYWLGRLVMLLMFSEIFILIFGFRDFSGMSFTAGAPQSSSQPSPSSVGMFCAAVGALTGEACGDHCYRFNSLSGIHSTLGVYRVGMAGSWGSPQSKSSNSSSIFFNLPSSLEPPSKTSSFHILPEFLLGLFTFGFYPW
jgi:hypothetical protein